MSGGFEPCSGCESPMACEILGRQRSCEPLSPAGLIGLLDLQLIQRAHDDLVLAMQKQIVAARPSRAAQRATVSDVVKAHSHREKAQQRWDSVMREMRGKLEK